MFFCLFVCLSDRRSFYVAVIGLEAGILLPQLPEFWDYKYAPWHYKWSVKSHLPNACIFRQGNWGLWFASLTESVENEQVGERERDQILPWFICQIHPLLDAWDRAPAKLLCIPSLPALLITFPPKWYSATTRYFNTLALDSVGDSKDCSLTQRRANLEGYQSAIANDNTAHLAHWSGEHPALEIDLSLVPSIHLRELKTTCHSSFRGHDALSWTPQAPAPTCVYTHTDTHTH